jgi:protein SCO1/2
VTEHLGEQIPLDAEYYDETGHLVTLRSVIDRPTVITFVYYRCPGICSPLLNELSRMVEKMDLEPGADYRILTLGFDHREGPELAAEKKENYLALMQRPVPPDAWRFFVSDSVTIQRVTQAAGFGFARDGNDYVHAGVLIVLSPEGKIMRYINATPTRSGVAFLPFDLKMAIIEASNGKTGPTISKVLAFCYSYDEERRTYAFNVTRVGLVVVLAAAAIFAFVFLRRPKNTHKEKGGTQ